jgi:hypothetical protein
MSLCPDNGLKSEIESIATNEQIFLHSNFASSTAP